MKRSIAGYSRLEIAFAATLATLVGILAITKYLELSELTEGSLEAMLVTAIEQGLTDYGEESRYIGRKPPFPPVLDHAEIGGTGIRNPFFVNIIDEGIAVEGWSKTGSLDYVSPNGIPYQYDPSIGSFGPTADKNGKQLSQPSDTSQ
ncbi:MAG: hypothetical protein GY703_05930 [Gammaproteobacteria bacterium]|nr:hypothetical protein [Gammaproteobacteria bacterium]